MRSNAVVRISSWADDFTAWQANGGSWIKECTYAGGTHKFSTQLAHVNENGDLILSDDPAQQHNLVYGTPIGREDVWSVDFDLSMELPEDSWFAKTEGWTQCFAEGSMVGVQNVGSGCQPPQPLTSGIGAPENFYGFRFYSYGTVAQRGIQLIAAGESLPSSLIPESDLGGITMIKPFHVSLSCTDGVMTLTIEQDGLSYTMDYSIADAFGETGRVYLTMAATTGWWYGTGVPWMLTRLSNFSGELQTVSPLEFEPVTDGSFAPFSSDTWKNGQKSTFSDGVLKFIPASWGKENCGVAISRRTIPTDRPFRAEVDIKLLTGENFAEGLSMFLYPESNGMAFPTRPAGGGAATIRMTTAPGAVGFSIDYYSKFADFFTNGIEIAGTKVSPIQISENRTLRARFEHDGAGNFTFVLDDGEAVRSSSLFAPEILKEKTARLGFWGGPSDSWAAYLGTNLENLRVSFGKPVSAVAVRGHVAVEPDAAATLQLDAASVSAKEEPDASLAFGGGKWTLKGDASQAADRLTLTTANGKKSAGICSEVVSATEPFAVEFDAVFGNGASDNAEGFSFVLRPASIAVSGYPAPQNSAYPKLLEDSCMFVTYTYGGGWLGFCTNGVEVSDAKCVPSRKFQTNSKVHVRLDYDGAGELLAHLVRADGTVCALSYRFPEAVAWGTMRMSFYGACSSWGSWMAIALENFTFSNVVPDIPSETVSVGALNLLTFGEGASLALSSLAGPASLGVSEVAVAGVSAGTIGEDVSMRIGGFSFSGDEPGALVLGGLGAVSFADPLAFSIPDAWSRKSAFALVDCSAAQVSGDLPTERPLTDETGKVVRRGTVSCLKGVFRYFKRGLALMLR